MCFILFTEVLLFSKNEPSSISWNLDNSWDLLTGQNSKFRQTLTNDSIQRNLWQGWHIYRQMFSRRKIIRKESFIPNTINDIMSKSFRNFVTIFVRLDFFLSLIQSLTLKARKCCGYLDHLVTFEFKDTSRKTVKLTLLRRMNLWKELKKKFYLLGKLIYELFLTIDYWRLYSSVICTRVLS